MSMYQKLGDRLTRREATAVCVVVSSRGSTPRKVGSKMLVYPDGSIDGTVGGGEMESRVIAEALSALADGQSRTLEYTMTDPKRGDPGVCGGTMEVFVEPVLPEPTIAVVGAGHVGQAVVRLAKWLGYRVIVSDDRGEYANAEKVPCADEYHVGPGSTLPNALTLDAQTYVLLTTRNMEVDLETLPALLETDACYIGVIGSKRRWATAREALLAAGHDSALIDRVVSPMGLEINAETPEEIAVSMLAEITQLRRGGSGRRMSEE